jgi:hypothetical protein
VLSSSPPNQLWHGRVGRDVWEGCGAVSDWFRARSSGTTPREHGRCYTVWFLPGDCFGGRRKHHTRYGVDGGSGIPPRGAPGRREYVIGNRWVTKIRSLEDSIPSPALPTSRPYAVKFRTLKRKRSDEAAVEKEQKKVRGRRAMARKSSVASAKAAEPPDCLGL